MNLMKKILLVVVGVFILFNLCEARIYTNTQRGYSVYIPDYFVEQDNCGGMYDFIADGGDNFGTEQYCKGEEGISVSIVVGASDIQELDPYIGVDRRIEECYRLHQQFFDINKTHYKVRPWAVRPKHFGVISEILEDNGRIIIGTEVIAHGKKISISVTGQAHSEQMAKQIANTAYDILDSFVCLKH